MRYFFIFQVIWKQIKHVSSRVWIYLTSFRAQNFRYSQCRMINKRLQRVASRFLCWIRDIRVEEQILRICSSPVLIYWTFWGLLTIAGTSWVTGPVKMASGSGAEGTSDVTTVLPTSNPTQDSTAIGVEENSTPSRVEFWVGIALFVGVVCLFLWLSSAGSGGSTPAIDGGAGGSGSSFSTLSSGSGSAELISDVSRASGSGDVIQLEEVQIVDIPLSSESIPYSTESRLHTRLRELHANTGAVELTNSNIQARLAEFAGPLEGAQMSRLRSMSVRRGHTQLFALLFREYPEVVAQYEGLRELESTFVALRVRNNLLFDHLTTNVVHDFPVVAPEITAYRTSRG